MKWEQLVKLGCELPEVVEGIWFRTPSLEVRGKSFVRLKEDGQAVVFLLESVDEQEFLIQAMPELYFITDHYRGWPAVLARLAKLRVPECRRRLEQGWRLKAPKSLVKQLEPARATGSPKSREHHGSSKTMAKNPRELQPIDAYLEELKDPAAKKTLGALRMQLRKLLPGAVETISYQMPTFKVDGKAVAGFAFFKSHCGYYPFSGSVVPALKAQLDGYATSKSGVTFPPDKPLPAKLVKTLVQARLAEIAASGKKPSATKKKVAAKKALITDRVTDSAVKEATGRDWKGWMRALDKAGAGELNHKQLVAHLAREVESSWWQQSIAVAYEQARGKRVVGETAATGFQVGVVRTLPVSAHEMWERVATQAERWLGAGATLTLEPGAGYEVPKRRGVPGVRGEVRVVKPGQRIRMTWQPEGWRKPATLQLTLVPKARGVSFHVHMEKLPDAKAREAMREHWSRVLEELA